MRSGAKDMPLQLDLDQRFPRAVRERLKRQCSCSFNYFTRAESYYPQVTSVIEFRNLPCVPRVAMVSVLPKQTERMRCLRAEHGQNVPRRLYVTCLQITIQELQLSIYMKESVSLKGLKSFDSEVQSNSTSTSKTIHFQLGIIVCISSKYLKIIVQKRCVLAYRLIEEPKEVIATRDILCLVENTSIRGEMELGIE